MGYIYKITNILNQKHYIGQTNNIERRYKEHFIWKLNGSQYIDQIISDIGQENFSFEVIEECDLTLLDEREKYWIKYYDSFYNGYNRTKGGSGEFYGNPKVTIEDVKQIRIAYNNHEDRREVYKLFNDKITFEGFCHIWEGNRWKEIMPEVYSDENKNFHKNKSKFSKGGSHPSAKLTDEEVINIRKRYVNETATQIWQDYKDKYTLGSFKQILIGVKFSHLPIYKKQQRSWINIDYTNENSN